MEILILPVAVLGFFSAWGAAQWALGPLDRAAKNRRYPIQFSLADFLCLFVQVELALAGPAMLFRASEETRRDTRQYFVLCVVCAVIMMLVLLIWWTGVRTLSRAGVHGAIGRTAALTIVIPFGYAAAYAIPIVAFMIIGSMTDGRPNGLPQTSLLLLVEIALVVFVFVLGLLTRRILSTADRQRPTPPVDGPAPPV